MDADPLRLLLESVRDELAAEDDARWRREAERFLAGLDPESQAGQWFEAFAESFPSRRAAALAYVKG